MHSFRKRTLRLAALLSVGGCCIASGCGVGSFLGNLNPCGVIFACNPAEWEFLTSGYEGPGADPTVTPFCTYPPLCPDTVDPIAGGIWP